MALLRVDRWLVESLLGIIHGDMKARTLAPFTHSFHILLLCVRVTTCCVQLWQLSQQQMLQAPAELKGACGWSKSPCFHALKDAQLSPKVTSVPKRTGEQEGWMLFPGSTQPSVQMQSPCASTSLEHLLPAPYPAPIPPGPSQNLASFPRNPSFLQIDVLSWSLIPANLYLSSKGRLMLHS